MPYCPIHFTTQVLASASKSQEHSQVINNLMPWSNITRAEHIILALIYFEGLTLKETSACLDLSESRIRKIHYNLLLRLYPYLKDASEIIYPFSPNVNESDVIKIREFNNEFITYLAEHPNYLYNFNPRNFERLIAHILGGLGFDVHLTAFTRDGGCDIVAFSTNALGIQSKYIVECKRYRPDCPVGVRLVRSLYGIKDIKQAQHAILATTSYFTHDAIAFAETPSVLGLHLKDINDICKWLQVCSISNPKRSVEQT